MRSNMFILSSSHIRALLSTKRYICKVENPSCLKLAPHNCESRARDGHFKLRGNTPLSAWKGVLISSGEFPLVEESNTSGMLARSIQIGGSPLGRVDKAMGTFVAEVNSIIRDNYGQVYSLFIERLIGLSETRRGQLREQFEQRRRCYEEEAKGSSDGKHLFLQPPRPPAG